MTVIDLISLAVYLSADMLVIRVKTREDMRTNPGSQGVIMNISPWNISRDDSEGYILPW